MKKTNIPVSIAMAVAACAGCKDHGSRKTREDRLADRPVPVVLAKVEARDLPMHLDGLGTVTAFKTVTVRSQVEGRLENVFFREGQAVKRGTLLAQVDPRAYVVQLHQAQAALARDSAQLQGSRVNLDRYSAVGKDKLIAQQQVDDQGTLVGQLEGAVKADHALIDQAKLMLDYARIRSPIDGITGVRLVDPGNLVHPNDASGIVVVTQIDPMTVLFTLPQDDLPQVKAAMAKATLKVSALSRDGGTTLGQGELALVDNQINAATATIRLKAVFPNPTHALWPNQFVKVRLILGTRQNAVVAPAVAIQNGPNGTFVYAVGADKKATPKPVEVALIDSDLAIIAKGLDVGETVVTEGQFQLKPGAMVDARAKDSSGAPTGGRAGRRVTTGDAQ